MKNSNELIRIHGAFPYDRGGKSRWLLTEMGIPYENRWLNPEKGDFESPEYLKLHPMGRVPSLQVGDTTMFESGAMVEFLADRYAQQLGEKALAPELTSPHRATYLQWLYFASNTIDPMQTRIMIIEDIAAGEVRTTKETALVNELRDAVHAMDLTLSKNSYLVAHRFSAADICVGYHLYWLKLWPELNVVIEAFPKVVAYLDRLKKMPSAVESKVFSYEG
jgi:glutathione S-transferase